VAVLTVMAVLAVIAAIMYLTEPTKSLPGILGAIIHPASGPMGTASRGAG